MFDDVERAALPHPAALTASRTAAVARCVQQRSLPSAAVTWERGRRDTIRHATRVSGAEAARGEWQKRDGAHGGEDAVDSARNA